MIKIGDKVYFDGKHYTVVCMDRAHHGLALIDHNDYIVNGRPVIMVPKTVQLEPIATKTFELGDKVISKLRENGAQPMIGTVVGYELNNRLIVKSDRGNDRVRYSYSPSELAKHTVTTISIPLSNLIEMHNGQLKFNLSSDDDTLAELINILKNNLR